ncbi:MAG: carboxylating nicotinate-nucleotide diphosphorylase [Chitinophagaceae bacterium]
MILEKEYERFIRHALNEDVGDGDHSTLACIPVHVRGKAVLKIKETGILAGMETAKKIFRFLEPEAIFIPHKNDGDAIGPGDTAFVVEATAHTILKGERLVLNCMQRMSGIATLTRQYTQLLRGYTTQLMDTRKTTPNFRMLEKEAVRIGGGKNHRMGLYDMILLKDNHIDFCGGIEKAILLANHYLQQHHLSLPIEVETRNILDVKRVLATGGVNRILLDNFTPVQVEEALDLIRHRFETEASGGIHLQNLEAFARTGVDFISAGAVIHHAVSLDLSLKAVLL